MDKGLVGLRNRGNTCYLNTSIQCLSNVELLKNYFTSDNYLLDLNNRYDKVKEKKLNEIFLSKEFAKLIKVLWLSTSRFIDPKNFHELMQKMDERFIGFEEQDSQEALSFILDSLHEGLKYNVKINYRGKIENSLDKIMVESIENWKSNFKDGYSIISELFFGQFLNKIISLEKNNKNKTISKKFEMFSILSIPIYGNTLYESMEKYFEKEKLESKYLDEKTNNYIDVYKHIRLIRIPKYLIIVLKRYINSNGFFIKSNGIITFPIDDLDLSLYTEGYDKIKSNLRLISVGCHTGCLNGGHYYTICRHINNNWYKYDDEHVSEYSLNLKNNTIFKEGYILIYEKIDSK